MSKTPISAPSARTLAALAKGGWTRDDWTWEQHTMRAADRFAATYRSLLGHWGGTATGGDRWRLPGDSPFSGSHLVAVDGDTVTVAAADSAESLADVAPEAR